MKIYYYDGCTQNVRTIEFSADGKNAILDGFEVVELSTIRKIVPSKVTGGEQ